MREAGVFQKKWFFGTLPTNGAAGLLARQPAHAFFVRNSNTRPGHFVFSHLTRDRKIKHTLILYNAQGKYTLARQAAQAYLFLSPLFSLPSPPFSPLFFLPIVVLSSL
jgi:hypothetical protein